MDTVAGLSVHVKSSLTPLPFDAYEVIGLLQAHDTRLQRGIPYNPTCAILPSRSHGRSNPVDEMRKNGITMIEECLRKPPPASFTLQFEVSHTIPALSDPTSIDSLNTLCSKKKDGTSSFRFALHIKDASSEMDVLCLGQAAKNLLGIQVKDVLEKSDKCQEAIATLSEITLPGSVCEGKVRSILGKDGKMYFIMTSMFCITA